MRILVTGAAGSGTSTLARALATVLGARAFEADDYFWLSTDPPFTTKRDPKDRLSLFLRDLEHAPAAVIAGSIIDWGLELEDSLSLIVFPTAPSAVRVERLRRREEALFGRADPKFLEWLHSTMKVAYPDAAGRGMSSGLRPDMPRSFASTVMFPLRGPRRAC